MPQFRHIERVVDLTDTTKNVIYNMGLEQARECVNEGRAEQIEGSFALVAVEGKTVRLARTIGRPMRYFIAKLEDGPCLVMAERIDEIHHWLRDHGLDDQFHPSYTRMAPAHYVTEIHLVGCPDPNPVYRRFFTPRRNSLPADIAEAVQHYFYSPRLQRRLATAVGDHRAMLPYTVNFIDPLFSSGIAFTLHAIARLAALFEHFWGHPHFSQALKRYDQKMQAEIDLLDTLIHGSYLAFPYFPIFVAYSMYSFAAAIFTEHQHRLGLRKADDGFLLSDDASFRTHVELTYRWL